jgi:hypothetical protein
MSDEKTNDNFEEKWENTIAPLLSLKLMGLNFDVESLKLLCYNIYLYGQIDTLKQQTNYLSKNMEESEN